MTEQRYFKGDITWNKPACHSPEILEALIANSLNQFLLAETDMTVNALRLYIQDIQDALRYFYPAATPENGAFTSNIYKHAIERVGALQQSYDETNPEEYLKAANNTDPQAYFDGLCKALPEVAHQGNINGFLKEYFDLDKDHRVSTALAFLGLLFVGLHDTAFASLCKNKHLDASAMTFEQKMNEPLDPEALYTYLQGKLNVA